MVGDRRWVNRGRIGEVKPTELNARVKKRLQPHGLERTGLKMVGDREEKEGLEEKEQTPQRGNTFVSSRRGKTEVGNKNPL